MTVARFLRFTGAANTVLLTVVLTLVGFMVNDHRSQIEAGNKRFYLYKTALLLRESSNNLTSFARAYVATGDERYRAAYNEVLDTRNGLEPGAGNSAARILQLTSDRLDNIQSDDSAEPVPLSALVTYLDFTAAERTTLLETERRSNELARIEREAFAALNGLYDDGSGNYTLAGAPDPELATRLLFDEGYRRYKTQIMQPIEAVLDSVEKRTTAEFDQHAQDGRVHAYLIGVAALLMLAFTLLTWRRIFKRVAMPILELQKRTHQIDADLENLTRSAGEIALGESVTSFEVSTRQTHSTVSDEVGDLNRTFDTMIETFHSTGDAITRIIGEQKARAAELDRINAELKQARDRLTVILQSLGEGVHGLDTQGRILFENPASLRLLGWESTDEMIGKHAHSTIHHSSRVGVPYPVEDCPIYKTLTDGQARRVDDEVFWRRDGSSFPVEYSASPMYGNDGRISGAVVVFRDATEREQLAVKRRETQAELEHLVAERTAGLKAANEELEAFSYSVSHDLRAPLRGIGSFIQIITEDYGPTLDEEGNRLLGIVADEARRMDTLIDDLLHFSHIGRQQIQTEDFDMAELVQNVYDSIDTSNHPATEFRLGALPAAHCDPSLLRQVWLNLLSNALKFTGNSVAASIEVGGDTADGVSTYYVKDNGAGFDPRHAHKLFGVFQRLHSESEFEGTGIGLALVQRIVKRHGGDSWADGAPGQGATFFFTLPASQQVAA